MSQHCKPPEQPTCKDHSGIEMWMKGIGAMIGCCVSLLAYSVFWQAPNIRADIAKEISRLDKQDSAAAYECQSIRREIGDITRRVSVLEGKE